MVGNDYEQITMMDTPAKCFTGSAAGQTPGAASVKSNATSQPTSTTNAGQKKKKEVGGLTPGAGERLETLAAFLETIGPQLDDEAWQYHAYFEQVLHKIEIYSRWKKVPSRLRCLLQDVLDLRKDNWRNKKLSKKKLDAPTTLSKESKDCVNPMDQQFPKVGTHAKKYRNLIY